LWPGAEGILFGAFSGEDIFTINGIVNPFGFNQALMSYSDIAQGINAYVSVDSWSSSVAFNGYGQQNLVIVNNNGVSFYFNGIGYNFPTNVGLPNQVLTTDGSNQLSWQSAGGEWGWGGAFISSLNGLIGDVTLTTDDIQEGTNSQFIYTKRFTISSAQLLNLHNNPIQVLVAPGQDKIITIVDAYGRLNAGDTPYTITWYPNVSVYYQDQNPAQWLKTNLNFLW